MSSASDLNWWTLGVALAGILGGQAEDAFAVDIPIPEAIVEEVAKAAPTWVAPLVLAFPVASYFLFTVYREKVINFILCTLETFSQLFNITTIDLDIFLIAVAAHEVTC